MKNFIGGNWIASSSRKTLASKNPVDEKTIARFQDSNEGDVKKAIAEAKKALPAWRKTPAPKRAEVLLKAAQIMKESKEELARLCTLEMGKIMKESRGDVQEAIDTTEYMAGEGRRFFGHTTPSEMRDKFAMTTRVPIGVVGLICPWNFPFAIPAWKTTPALLCGNTVVLKPSSDTPLCASEFVKVLEKAGVPPGVVNMVTGSGERIGSALAQSKELQSISFTGSRKVGEWISANTGLKKLGLELGGKNAIIVMDDADLELALEGVLWSAFGTTGQRCTAASRIIVHEKVYEQFADMLLKRARKIKMGSGLDGRTEMGPLVNEKAVEKCERYAGIGVKEGAKLMLGGRRRTLNGKGHFFEPTVFIDASPGMRIAQEEIFGPIACMMKAKSLADAVKKCNSIEYGLSSSIYTKSIDNAFRAIGEIEAGLTYVNSGTIGSEVHLPFGGVKSTGNGTREAGIEGIHEFSETKTVYIDYSGKLQKAQIDDYENARVKQGEKRSKKKKPKKK